MIIVLARNIIEPSTRTETDCHATATIYTKKKMCHFRGKLQRQKDVTAENLALPLPLAKMTLASHHGMKKRTQQAPRSAQIHAYMQMQGFIWYEALAGKFCVRLCPPGSFIQRTGIPVSFSLPIRFERCKKLNYIRIWYFYRCVLYLDSLLSTYLKTIFQYIKRITRLVISVIQLHIKIVYLICLTDVLIISN